MWCWTATTWAWAAALLRRWGPWVVVVLAATTLASLLAGSPSGEPLGPESGDLRVYVTLDGEALIDLPFDQAHTLTVIQHGTGENTVQITGDAVYMEHADCENQDCVQMGEVTLHNLEARVLGGFIVCLPHKLVIEIDE